MTLNRAISPPLKPINEAKLIEPVRVILPNGLPVFIISSGTQDVCRIEVIFKAGTVLQKKPLAAAATNALMREGTQNYSANQISEIFDFYGSFLENSVDRFYAGFSLYSLNKHLGNVVDVFTDILFNPIFPQNEFDLYKSNQLQKFKVNQQKVDFISRNHFPSLLVGEKHPYGRYTKETDFANIQLGDIVDFYNQHYLNQISFLVVSGKINDEIIKLISDKFGKRPNPATKDFDTHYWVASPALSRKHFIHKPDALQSAIRIGRMLFSKNHPDYFGFQVLNVVLGGYFGSRLMSNLREDKGYTYGIGSGVSPLKKGGIFYISTEVGVDVTRSALKEIYHEIKRLREELVPDNELEIVKNYILGVFLKSSEGPFAQADKFKAVYEFGLGYDYYSRYFQAVKAVTPKQLQTLAQKYLKEEDLFELVVGKV